MEGSEPGQAAGSRWRARLRAHWHWAIPAVTLVLLLYPLASDRTFASDWGNHVWLIWAQGKSIAELGEPSYYLQSTLGAFYPYYAFYGGTMYAVLGFFSWLTSANLVIVLTFVSTLAVVYFSWTWLAVQAGIRGWTMQLPGLLAVTAPYAVTSLYGRGDVPEMIATSMIPLIAAAGLSLVRHERVQLRAAAAFVVGIAVMTGTHTLTLIWGTTFLVLCGLGLVAYNWRAARDHARRGLRLLYLGTLGVAINAWMLVPLVAFHKRLMEGGPDPMSFLGYTDHTQLFSLFRNGALLYPTVTADLNTQLPVLLALWAVAFGAVYWGLLSRESKRLTAVMAALCAFFLLLIMTPSLIEQLPTSWRYIQFPYRLLTYFDIALVGATTLILAGMQRAGRSARVPAALLALVGAIALFASVRQDHDVRSWLTGRDAITASVYTPPPSWYAPLQFADASAPIVEPSLAGQVDVPITEGPRDSYTVEVSKGPAGTVFTNVLTSTYFVDVEGAEPVGRTPEGRMVIRLPASDKPREVTFRAHWSRGVDVGRWISLAAIAVAVIGFAWMLADRERFARLRRPFSAGGRRDG